MELQNCWEFWNCQKEIMEKCPAYETDSGKSCFYVASDYCLRIKKEFNDCQECPWFERTFWLEHYI
jgi:hypothetical protein